ncbi:MAG: hypothetical protein Q8R01_08865 [Ramlibacter sp.]|nr:hypothetical protein [Ramlibacter sp.]
MKSTLVRIPLNGTEEQHRRLLALQAAFVQVCNALAPMVQEHRCWHRVTLHHLSYKVLRERFPAVGSQMVCNAIYSVCRMARVAFQHPASPVNLARLNGGPLPTLHFADNSPVYFDRHTLSVKGGKLSMYTLDGRMRFDVALSPTEEERFHTEKLREVVLARNAKGLFELSFWFAPADEDEEAGPLQVGNRQALLPEYVKVEVPQQ